MMQIGAQTCYMPLTRNGNRKGLAILNFESQEILDAAVGKGYYVGQHVIKIVAAETKICHQCKSMDHLVKDFQIAKEIKEREFRQKQNYQRFNQTYRKYQPRIYNTLSNRYTNQTNTYAEITRRRGPNFNERQQSQTHQNGNKNENQKIMQLLENITNRLGKLEENIAQPNERVDHIQFDREIQREERISRNLNTHDEQQFESYKNLTNSVTNSTNNNDESNNSQNEIAQYLGQIMGKLENMESQITNAHQRIDRAIGNQHNQQGENYNTQTHY
ncbi:hypothetical protein Glove_196g48 [Diversispora epigaea]|uniref:Uncharacterized protein n=1 Tax=Diversispora epigaea TaxID=1348612 RepID=A0A397ING6_9GLOM|nr:hypothetical protein Glove_196g48 [Diversispora epigaea]